MRFMNLKSLIKTASSRRFGATCSNGELTLFVTVGVLLAGVISIPAWTRSLTTGLSAMSSAVIFIFSVLSIYRVVVPFVLRISYAEMLRIRHPMYVWLSGVLFVVCLCDPLLSFCFNLRSTKLSVLLIVIAVSGLLKYYVGGRLWHLLLSACAIGIAVALSTLGLCGLFFILVISQLIYRELRAEYENEEACEDVSAMRMARRLIDPYAVTMTRVCAIICFCVGALLGVAYRIASVGMSPGLIKSAWMSCWSVDGIVLVTAGIVPLAVVLRGIGRATDTMDSFGVWHQVKYVMIGSASAGLLLVGDIAVAKLHTFVSAVGCYWLMGRMAVGLALLIAASVLIVDVWCRMAWAATQTDEGKRRLESRFFRGLFFAIPLVLVLAALCIRYYVQVKHWSMM